LNPFADATAAVFGGTAAVYFTAGLVEGTTATAAGCKPYELGGTYTTGEGISMRSDVFPVRANRVVFVLANLAFVAS
jgi:hypothetical protein